MWESPSSPAKVGTRPPLPNSAFLEMQVDLNLLSGAHDSVLESLPMLTHDV